jgi:hypothetical protein
MQQMRLGPIAGAVAIAALAASAGLAISLGTIAKPAAPTVQGTSPALVDEAFIQHRQLETGARPGTKVEGYHPGGFGGPRLDSGEVIRRYAE